MCPTTMTLSVNDNNINSHRNVTGDDSNKEHVPSAILRGLMKDLGEIRRQNNHSSTLVSIERMYSVLSLSRSKSSNDRLCRALVSLNALEIITSAISAHSSFPVRQEDQQRQVKFIDRGLRCIVRIMVKSKERTTYFVNHVCLDGILRLMKRYQANIELQCQFLALLMCIPRSVDPIRSAFNTKNVMPSVVRLSVDAMCIHQESPLIFQTVCCVIHGWRMCVKFPIMDRALFSRLVNCIWHGLDVHAYHERSQKAGQQALRLLVGRSMAQTMINQVSTVIASNTTTSIDQQQQDQERQPQQERGDEEVQVEKGHIASRMNSKQCAPAA